MSLNFFLPDYFLREVHHLAVHSSPEETYQAMCDFDMSEVPWISSLFRLRTVFDKEKSNSSHLTLRDAYRNGGFVLLNEIPDQQLIVGAIGKIWRPAIAFKKVDSFEYADFHQPGFAKVAWSLRCEPRIGGGAFCSFEVRVGATDSVSAAKMRGYYSLIGPFSRAIRRSIFARFRKKFGNVLADEPTRSLAGDTLIMNPIAMCTDGIYIEAPPDAIWPWIVQMGCLRAGWYSYDFLDNAAVPSSNRIVPEWQNLIEGDSLNWTPQEDHGCFVNSIDRCRSLVLGSCYDYDRKESVLPDINPLPSNYSRSSWSFVLEPQTSEVTRLIVRVRSDYHLPKQMMP
ncbi:hypothetical protein L0152_05970, partial [bacterium]|nr:hypothetical protein [bacterium]